MRIQNTVPTALLIPVPPNTVGTLIITVPIQSYVVAYLHSLKYSYPVNQGGKEMHEERRTGVEACGEGIFMAQAVASLPTPPPAPLPAATATRDQEARKEKPPGIISLDPEVLFPDTEVGRCQVGKVRDRYRYLPTCYLGGIVAVQVQTLPYQPTPYRYQ